MNFLSEYEFKDVRHLKTLRLDGNNLALIVDKIFDAQRSLEVLGK